MRINDISDKDFEKDDFFGGRDIQEPEKEPKKPVLKPDDPKYWDEPESEWEHLHPKRRWELWGWVAVAGIVIGVAIGVYLRYFSPYIDEATQVGYVEKIEKKGDVLKTYEGVILPYKELEDTTRIYERDFVFSVSDPHVASILKRVMFANRPVRVEYKVYHGRLPWRGDSKILVTGADTVSRSKILPPEFAPVRR